MAFTFMELAERIVRHFAGTGNKHAESALTVTDITTNDVSTTKHGFTPKAPNDTTKFLRGDATWAVPGGITSVAEVATTSGTSIDFTGIPSTVKRITVMFDGVSGNGTSIPILQLGDSGGPETSGYNGVTQCSTQNGWSSGVVLRNAGAAATWTLYGKVTLTLQDAANTWAISVTAAALGDATNASSGGGIKQTSATLDRVRLTHVNGTDTFDAGSMSIAYE